MKLPTILAQAAVPTSTGADYAQARPTGLEAAAGAARQVTQDIQSMQQFELKRHEQEQVSQVAEVQTTFRGALGSMENELELGVRDPVTDQFTTLPATEKDYFSQHQQKVQQLRTNALAGIQDPLTKRAAALTLDKIIGEHTVKAQAHEGRMWLGKEKARITTLRQDYASRAAMDPDLIERARAETEWNALINVKEAGRVVTPEEARIHREAFKKEVVEVEGTTAAHKGFFEPEKFVGRMDPSRIVALTEHSDRRAATIRKKEEDDLKAEMKKDSDNVEKDLVDLYTTGDINGAREKLVNSKRIFTEPGRYEHWHDKLSKPPIKGDDPEAEREANQIVYSETIPLSLARSRYEQLSGRLKPDTDRIYRGHLEVRANRELAAADQIRNRAETDRNRADAQNLREQAQVEQQIQLLIPRSGEFGETKVENAQILGDFISDMARNNPANGGKIRPLDYFEKYKDRAIARSTDASLSRIMELRKSNAPYMSGMAPDIGKLEADRDTLFKKDPTGRLYYQHFYQLRELKSIGAEVLRLGGKLPALPTAPAPMPAPATAAPVRTPMPNVVPAGPGPTPRAPAGATLGRTPK